MIEAFFASLNDKNKRLLIAGGIVLGAFLIGWLGIVQPSLKKIRAVEIEKKELSDKDPILRDVLGSETRLADYQKYLASSRDLTPLIQELAGLAEKSSVRIVSISPEKNTAVEGEVERLSVAVEGEGSFHDLGEYISRIESLERFLRINHVEFGRGAQGDRAEPGLKSILLSVSLLYSAGDLAAV